MRGIAVLLVIFYHTGLAFHSAGFLGVDIFFVISGFLITGIVVRELQAGVFSFRTFYERRAKRILPAAFSVVALCYVLADLFLTSGVRQDFNETAIASIFFVSNVALWLQTDYFSDGASFQPLLHMWSLAIEEQFYVFLPLLLIWLSGKWRLRAVIALTLASLALCMSMVAFKPTATFYLMPTRAWELGCGAALAIATNGRLHTKKDWPVVGCLGALILLSVPLFAPGKAFGLGHPSLDAFLVCAGAILVLIARCPPLEKGLFSMALGAVGKISYSLYLVHWPIVAFLNNAYMQEDLNLEIRLFVFGGSVLLAIILHAAIERPLRQASYRTGVRYVVATLTGAVLVSGILHLTVNRHGSMQDFADRLRPNLGLNEACEFADRFTQIEDCKTMPDPQILVWGDSYAMHIVPALITQPDVRIAQATKSVCGPVIGLVPLHTDYLRGASWETDCRAFNQSVLDYIISQDSLEIIVLSSVLNQYAYLPVRGAEGRIVEMDPDALAAAFEQTVARLHQAQKRVIFIAPTPSEGAGLNPSQGFNVGLCLERQINGKLVAGPHHECTIRRSVFHEAESFALDTLRHLEHRINLPVIHLEPLLCTNDLCKTRIDDIIIYRDKGHLSYEGSIYLGEKFGILQRVIDQAR